MDSRKFIKPCFVLDIVLRLLHICASDISTTKIGLYDFSRNFIVDFRYFLNIFNKTSSESFTFFSIFTITIAVAPWLILSGNAVSMMFPFFNWRFIPQICTNIYFAVYATLFLPTKLSFADANLVFEFLINELKISDNIPSVL